MYQRFDLLFRCCRSGMDSARKPRQDSRRPSQVATNGYDRSGARGKHNCNIYGFLSLRWSRKSDSNRRPADYESAALPTELLRLSSPIVPLLSSSVKFRAQILSGRLIASPARIIRVPAIHRTWPISGTSGIMANRTHVPAMKATIAPARMRRGQKSLGKSRRNR